MSTTTKNIHIVKFNLVGAPLAAQERLKKEIQDAFAPDPVVFDELGIVSSILSFVSNEKIAEKTEDPKTKTTEKPVQFESDPPFQGRTPKDLYNHPPTPNSFAANTSSYDVADNVLPPMHKTDKKPTEKPVKFESDPPLIRMTPQELIEKNRASISAAFGQSKSNSFKLDDDSGAAIGHNYKISNGVTKTEDGLLRIKNNPSQTTDKLTADEWRKIIEQLAEKK